MLFFYHTFLYVACIKIPNAYNFQDIANQILYIYKIMINIPRDLKHNFYTYHSKYTKTYSSIYA